MNESTEPDPVEGPGPNSDTLGAATLGSATLLLRRASSGDRKALEELVRRTIGSLRIFLLAVSPPGTPVDDLVQETYLTAYSHLAQFDLKEKGTFHSWLCGIARNLLRREMRTRAYESRARDTLRDRAQMGAWERIAETPPEVVRERAARLRQCLTRLSSVQRELVSLRYGQDMSYDRLGQKFRRPAGWARTTVFRTRQLLRRCIERVEDSQAETSHA